MTGGPDLDRPDDASLVDRHLRVGLVALALFAVLGLLLEGLHAVKSPTFLDAGQETVRLLLRLGHAHGTGLALVNLGYGAVLHARPRTRTRAASTAVVVATGLVPAGFLAGGLTARAGDPGEAVALVPVGAALLIVALVATARRLG